MSHSWSGSLMYSKNGSSRREPWPSRRRKGLMPLVLGKRFKWSICSKNVLRSSDVIEPFSVLQTMQGTCLPLNSQVGPQGYNLPGPVFHSTKSTSVSTPSFLANMSRPVMTSGLMDLLDTITAHIIGSPVAAVKLSRVK